MSPIEKLCHETIDNLYKIIEEGKIQQAIDQETTESIISIIDDLNDIKPNQYDLRFCVSCSDVFEADHDTKPIEEHSKAIQNNHW